MLIAGLLLSLAAQPQEIYRWVDKDGIVHYADQPGSPDAVRVYYRGGPPSSDDAEPPALYESDRQDGPPVGPTYDRTHPCRTSGPRA